MKTKNKLPEACFALNRMDKKVIVIKRGETGYYKTDWPAGYTQADVDSLNIQRGVTKAQAMAMEVGSMFGWDVPGANPDSYNKID